MPEWADGPVEEQTHNGLMIKEIPVGSSALHSARSSSTDLATGVAPPGEPEKQATEGTAGGYDFVNRESERY